MPDRTVVIDSQLEKYNAQIEQSEGAVLETAILKYLICKLAETNFDGGGGGGAATSPADIATGINNAVDIDTIIDRLTSIDNKSGTSVPTKSTTIGFLSVAALNSNLLDSAGLGGWTDVSKFQSCELTFFAGAGGALAFATGVQSAINDAGLGLTTIAVPAVDAGTGLASIVVSVAANTILKLRYDLTGLNFIRLPMTTAIAGHRVIGVFNTNNVSNRVIAQIPGTVTTTVSGTANTNVLNTVVDTLQGPQTTTDVASSVITTTTFGAAVLLPTGLSYQVSFAVGAISGTLTQSIVRIQESSDSGINWRTVYTFEPITVAQGAKIYRSPSIAASGNRLRYSETITGTTPSITRTIFRTMSNVQGLINQDSRASSIYNTLNGTIDVAANGAIMAITALPTVATPLWLQLHDSPAAVTAGVRAFQSFRIPADGLILGFAYFGIGRQFVGMTNARIAISTTANTYTPIALAADTVQLFIESF